MIFGLILIFTALATPSWQVAYVRELQQWLQSGLWMSCKTRPSGMHMCSYAFSDDDNYFHATDDFVNISSPAFYTWQRTLLHVFLLGQLCALLSLISYCFAQSSKLEKVSHALFSGFVAFAALICTGSAITFAIFSYMVEYRFYHVSVSGVYEKHRGYSFHLALAGSLLYIVALLLSIPSTVYVIRRDSQLVRANEQNRMVLAAGGDKTSPKQESDLCEEAPSVCPTTHKRNSLRCAAFQVFHERTDNLREVQMKTPSTKGGRQVRLFPFLVRPMRFFGHLLVSLIVINSTQSPTWL
ncbi:hypothetical protein Y032_0095g2783 [Ancylostoma ceylanicum]|nr:hypothetical protein Y032_0095g2783 [Ancylostoma ceylanicum]